MLLQVFDENNAEEDFVPGERGSGKTASEKSDSNADTNILDSNDDQDEDKVEKIFGLLFRDIGTLQEKLIKMKFLQN